jgi:hypothetical protein
MVLLELPGVARSERGMLIGQLRLGAVPYRVGLSAGDGYEVNHERRLSILETVPLGRGGSSRPDWSSW